jgi:hypothetical protein
MALRGTKPSPDAERLKLLMSGEAGVGKTLAAIQFPAPYVLDCEKGTVQPQYCKLIDESRGHVYHCPDIREAQAEVRALITETHDFQTLVVDGSSVIHAKEADAQLPKVGDAYQAHVKAADREMRRLFSLIQMLDMNVIVTAHSKAEWENGATTGRKTYDGWKKLDYVFDLWLELTKDKKKGAPRLATVRKTRLAGFPDGESFPWTWEEIARRYPKAASGKTAATLALASPEQIADLRALIAAVNNPEFTMEKCLLKCGAEAPEDMPAAAIQKAIDYLASKLPTIPSRLPQSNGRKD